VAIFVPAVADREYLDGPLTVFAVRRPFARRVHADTAVRRGIEFLTAWLLPTVAARLASKVEAFRPDVVLAHNVSRTGPWLVRWAKMKRAVFIRVYHDLSDTCWRRSRQKGGSNCVTVCGTCRLKIRIMRSVWPPEGIGVCVSKFVASELTRAELIEPRSTLIGYPISGSPPKWVKPDGTTDGKTLTLGFIGRVAPTKGIDDAIRVVASYTRRTGRPVSLLIAGDGQAGCVETLKRLAAAEAVDVHFAGYMDIDTFCGRVDAVLIPSTWLEPFGRAAVEVGVRNVPMLVSPLGGLPEAARSSGGKYALADFRNTEVAAACLADLLRGQVSQPVDSPGSEPSPGALEDTIELAVRRVLAVRVA
jgi:glycosyltransferase involved in cell wall biosynthesis